MFINYIIIVPARSKSCRLNSKPILNLCGESMIIRTLKHAKLSQSEIIRLFLTQKQYLKQVVV